MIGNRHAHNAYETCAENARRRANKLRSVARNLSNDPIRAEGAELDRVRRRRAALIGNLYTLATRQEYAADHDWDEDPGHNMDAVDAVLDEASMDFQSKRMAHGIDTVVAATGLFDEALASMDKAHENEPSAAPSGMISSVTDKLDPGMAREKRERLERIDPERLRVGYRSMSVGLRAAQTDEAQADPTKP